MPTFEGSANGQGLRIGVAVSRFNEGITAKLLGGALETFKRAGVAQESIDVVWVPGAFELPQAARALDEARDYDGIAALGCVIRGETPHFDYVCDAAARGLLDLSLRARACITFGVLTCDTPEQAWARAGGRSNKGEEAAAGLIRLIGALRTLAERAS